MLLSRYEDCEESKDEVLFPFLDGRCRGVNYHKHLQRFSGSYWVGRTVKEHMIHVTAKVIQVLGTGKLVGTYFYDRETIHNPQVRYPSFDIAT